MTWRRLLWFNQKNIYIKLENIDKNIRPILILFDVKNNYYNKN